MKCHWILILTISYAILEIKGQNIPLYKERKTKTMVEKYPNLTITEHWQKIEKNIKKISDGLAEKILAHVFDYTVQLNISNQCVQETLKLVAGIRKLKPWALRFIDSSAKSIEGLMLGSLSSIGMYDECVDTVVYSEKMRNRGELIFRGQYCSLEFKPPLPPKKGAYKFDAIMPELQPFFDNKSFMAEGAKYAQAFYFISIRIGVCVPSGCTEDDINQVAELVGEQLGVDGEVATCEVKKETEFTSLNILSFCAFGTIAALVLIGSTIDIYSYYTKTVFNHIAIRVLLAFSFVTNFKKFSNTKSSSVNLRCLNGIRFLSMTWVLFGHSYLLLNFKLMLGLEPLKIYAKDFMFQAIINATYSVDSFFVMGGLLVCYLTVQFVKIQGKPFNIVMYILHRIWRILPVLTFVTFLIFLSNLSGDGPVFYETTKIFQDACYKNWWPNFLFIGNFFDYTEMCLPHTWYIAADFQLYLMALAVLIPLLRWPKIGITIAVLAIVSSMLYTGLTTVLKGFPPIMLMSQPDPEQAAQFWARHYFKPFVHIGPYFIGMLAGYLLAVKPDLKIPMRILIAGWITAFIGNFSVLYGVHEWNKGADPTFWESLFYAGLGRTVWGFGVAWVIVCCVTGHGGIVNYILSMEPLIPLSRLTFSAYLLHPLVQLYYISNYRSPMYPAHMIVVWLCLGHLCITYMASLILSMLVEAPFMSLEKIIFRGGDGKTQNTAFVNNRSNLNGSLKVEKNGNIAVIIHTDSSKSIETVNTTTSEM